MKNLLFSLLYIGGIIPSIVFGQTVPPTIPTDITVLKTYTVPGTKTIRTDYSDGSFLTIMPNEPNPAVTTYIKTDGSRYILDPKTGTLTQTTPPRTVTPKPTESEQVAPTKTPTDISVLNNLVNPKTFEGVPEGKNQQPLSKILNQLFFVGLVITIILAIIMIIVGGIQYMTIDAMASKESGKKRVQAALGGLLLAFSAILILNTINPNITSLRIVFPKFKEIKPIDIVGDLQLQSGTRFDAVTGQPNSGGGVGANSIVKGNFSNVTIADLRPHLSSNYSDSDLQAFVDAGRQYGIDPRFLASVSKFETANGTSKAFRDGRNNAMGTSNSVGPIGFSSVRDSIFTQANNLVKEGGYYSKATTIKQIGDIYSPSVNPATGKPYQNDINGTNWSWAQSVNSNYDQMTLGRTGN